MNQHHNKGWNNKDATASLTKRNTDDYWNTKKFVSDLDEDDTGGNRYNSVAQQASGLCLL